MLNIILFSSLLWAEESTVVKTITVETPAVEEQVEENALIPATITVDEEGNATVAPIPAVKEEEAPVKEEKKEEADVPEDFNEAAETVSLLVKAVQDKNWALVCGLLLTLIVFGANKMGLKNKVGSKAVPWVATALATATALGISLANGLPVGDAISQGLLSGLTAIGGWEMLFKHVLAPAKTQG